MIRTLSQEELALRWSEIKPHIDKAVDHGVGETSSMDMFRGAMAGNYECWEVVQGEESKCFGMVRINTFENHKQLQIVTTTGTDLDEYSSEALAYAEDYARYLGCKYVTLWGRLGWPRKLKQFGYKHIYSVCAKEV